MRWLKWSFILLALACIGIQFVPIHKNNSTEIPSSDFMVIHNPPIDIKNSIVVSCYDCHSNHTEYPWYSYIQPIGWIVQGDIDKGKNQLNFSEFENYSDRRKGMKFQSIINQIDDNKMPLSSYTLIHRNTKLSEKDKKMIIEYMTLLKEKL